MFDLFVQRTAGVLAQHGGDVVVQNVPMLSDVPAAQRRAIARVTGSVHGSEYMFSSHQKKKRPSEGGVGPEMRSPAGSVAPDHFIVGTSVTSMLDQAVLQ